MNIPIIFEDENLMVIDKPPGLVVDSSESQPVGTLQEILETEFKIKLDRGGIVHRLDKDTSGLIIIAKTPVVLENLQDQFKDRKVKKEYLALVHGVMEKNQTVNGAIARNPAKRENFIVVDPDRSTRAGKLVVTDTGKEAQTEFIPIKHLVLTEEQIDKIMGKINKNQRRRLTSNHYTKYTLIVCVPLTGRTHQIRVHLKYLGFPIVGDARYGGRKTSRLDSRWCPRQFLHAAKISFFHPITGKKMEFESKLPTDLKTALDNLMVED